MYFEVQKRKSNPKFILEWNLPYLNLVICRSGYSANDDLELRPRRRRRSAHTNRRGASAIGAGMQARGRRVHARARTHAVYRRQSVRVCGRRWAADEAARGWRLCGAWARVRASYRDVLQDLGLGERLAALGVAVEPHARALVVLVVRDAHVVASRAHNVAGSGVGASAKARAAGWEASRERDAVRSTPRAAGQTDWERRRMRRSSDC